MLHLDQSVPVDPRFPLSGPELMEIFEGLAAAFGLNAWELSLRIVDDGEMAELNDRFMGCLGPTNVLSFPGGDGDWLGDLVLSVDTLVRESRIYNQDPYEYAVRLLAHGLLHLMGHDHGPEMEALTELAVDSIRLDAEESLRRLFPSI